jgi:plastocyanin
VADNNSKTFDRTLAVMAVFAALTAVLAIVAALRAGETPAKAAEEGGPATANLELAEWEITGDLEIPPGDLSITLSNTGSMVHNLVFENGPRSVDVNGGETVTFEPGHLEPGTYTIFCDIAGHRAAGMEARLVVAGDPGEDAGDAEEDHGGATPTEMDQMMIDSMLAFPAETEGIGNQPLEPTEVRADGTKVFDLAASVIEWEVSPGEFVDAWAYNGMAPGSSSTWVTMSRST